MFWLRNNKIIFHNTLLSMGQNLVPGKYPSICLPVYLHLNSYLDSGDFCRLLITFIDNLDPDQARQNVRSDLD